MQPVNIFRIDMMLAFLAWGLLVGRYLVPWLRVIPKADGLALIATLHSFRFFGLAFLLPGYVSSTLSSAFAAPAAYGDLAAALLAIGTLLTCRLKPLFWLFAWAFNIVGALDLINNFVSAVRLDLPVDAGSFGASYWIPILYVPLLLITHAIAFVLLVHPERPRAIDEARETFAPAHAFSLCPDVAQSSHDAPSAGVPSVAASSL